MHLNKTAKESEIKDKCKKQLSNQYLNIDILRLNTEDELKTLIRLLEFESNLENAKWLIYLKNQTDFNNLFAHKPLIKNSCYQLLSKRLIEDKKIKRQIVNVKNYENYENITKDYSKLILESKILNHPFKGSTDEFKKRNKRGECTDGKCLDCLECEKNANEKIILTEKSSNLKGEKNERKLKRELDNEQKSMFEQNEILSHILHEFDCESSSTKFAICAYDVLEYENLSSSLQLQKANLDEREEQKETNRIEYQRSLWKTFRNSDNSNDNEKFIRTNLEGSKLVDLNASYFKEQTASNYLIAFDLLTKLQLVFISINLLFFIYLCLRLNKSQDKKKLNVLQPSLSTTHVHFDNFDNSLKFNQFDV